jgi:hypothetical protein
VNRSAAVELRHVLGVATSLTLACSAQPLEGVPPRSAPRPVASVETPLRAGGRGLLVSPGPAPAEVSPTLGFALRSYRRRLAVAIGVNTYGKGLSSLTAAVDDARRMAELFRRLGFNDVEEVEDARATREDILDLLEQRLPSKAGQEDLVVVFFAGHGLTMSDGGYILPAGSGASTRDAISVRQMKAAALRMKAKHVLYLVDACFSGSMLKRGARAPGNDLAFWEAVAKERAIQVLTAGGPDEVVFEFGGWGAFTRAVHAALEGAADADQDGVITFEELSAYVDGRVRRETKGAQHPQWGSVEGTGSTLMWDARRLPPEALPKPRTVRPLIRGIEDELRRIHELMERKDWVEAEKRLRELAVRRGDVELNLLLAEVYLEHDGLGNSSLVAAELSRVEAGPASPAETRRALELRERLEKVKRGAP